MSDLLTIGSSGISAYQRALATVSNNIANVNTEGYTRQDVSVAANQPRLIGGSYIGTGARFDAVKRQYDAFVESNLRNSQSDLKSQEPLLSYVNRLIDVMGDQSIGLTTAMNLFFESGRDLASDPASTVQRSIFLRDADGLAARFRQLSTQFELLDNETRQSIETDVGQVNSLTTQLAQLNKQLSKHSSVEDQPSELLDQRDLLLRKLSELLYVKTKFSDNGAVLVSVGDTLDQGILVRDNTSRLVSIAESENNGNQLKFLIDAYGKPETLAGMPSGRRGGLLNFRDQVLYPAVNSLDALAVAVTDEVNAVHREGIDAEGKIGGDLFAFNPGQDGKASGMTMIVQDATRVAAAGQFRIIDNPLNGGTAQARISYQAPQYAGPDGLQGDLSIGLKPQLGKASLKIQAGIGYTQVGVLPAGSQNLALTLLNPSPTQQLQVLTRDGRHLLGSGNMSSTLQSSLVQTSNGTEAGATYDASMLNASGLVSYENGRLTARAEPGEAAPAVLAGVFPENLVAPSGGFPADTFQINGRSLPEFKLEGGPISLNEVITWVNSSQASLPESQQVIASDYFGMLMLSRPASNTADAIEISLGSNPSVTHLAILGFPDAAAVTVGPTDPPMASLAGGLLTPSTGNIAAGALSIDGYKLPALNPIGGTLTLAQAVNWINGAGIPGIQASGVDGRLQIDRTDNDTTKPIELQVVTPGQEALLGRLGFGTSTRYLGMDIFMGAIAPVGQRQEFNAVTGKALPAVPTAAVMLSQPQLVGWSLGSALPAGAVTLNGISLGPLAKDSTLQDVANWINNSQASVPSVRRVTASIVKTEVAVAGGMQTRYQLEMRRDYSNTSDDIRLGVGPNGKPADLHALGFETALHIQGGTPDDLLIFVTDSGGTDSVANLQSSMTGQSGSLKQFLRESPLEVRFTSDTHYEIVDCRTRSVLAERQLEIDTESSTPSIQYRGLKLEFSTYPKSGDRFTIDGNTDGIGNNEAMLNLVALENAKVMPGGLTMTEAYIERVNQVGNVARQAAIAEQALTVVYRQALEARDAVSGVSLDEEASALVRFQQAYQANAKVMQTSLTLFEAILQVR